MPALQIIERDMLIATLLANTLITDLVGDRVLWEFIARKGKVDYPYIRVGLKYGGYTNVTNRRDTKSSWQVTGISNDDLDVAQNLINAIHDTLHFRHLIVPDDYEDEIQSIFQVLEEHSIFRSFKYHNQPLFEVGGLYCLKMTLCEVTV